MKNYICKRINKIYRTYKTTINRVNYVEVYKGLTLASKVDPLYIGLIATSALISTLGLLVNSTAVIIGAMIISPLMDPIMAGGLAFSTNNNLIAKRVSKSIMTGILLSIFFSAMITIISPFRDITPEILLRTNPNIYDLFIALFSGLAGAFSVCFSRISASFVGVAISVALMPPLCVTGIGLATKRMDIVWGSLLLFMTNLAAIFIVSTIFFLLLGFHEKSLEHMPPRKNETIRSIVSSYMLTFLLLVIISLPLVYTLKISIDERILNNRIHAILAGKFEVPGSSNIESWDVQSNVIHAKIYTDNYFSAEEIEDVNREIASNINENLILKVSQVPVLSEHFQKKSIPELISESMYPRESQLTNESFPDSFTESYYIKLLMDSFPFAGLSQYKLVYDDEKLSKVILDINNDVGINVEDAYSFIVKVKENLNISTDINVDKINPMQIYFEREGFAFTEQERTKLEKLALFLNTQSAYGVEAVGYSDSSGPADLNEYLARRRAEEIVEFLVAKGVSDDRINWSYQGSSLADTEEEIEMGRQFQRRVELTVSR